jgi:hypothetical protein
MDLLKRALRATVVVAFSLGVPVTPAAAATFVADPAAADGAAGSLRQLIGVANSNGIADTILLPAGTYRLTQGELTITQALRLEGQVQQASQVVITPEGRSRALVVNPPAANAVVLRRLQVRGGRAVGATGGGILKQGAGSLEVEESTLSGNSASGSQGGGGISSTAGNVSITRSALSGNSATVSVAGGGGGGILHTGGGALSLVNASLAGNSVTATGAPAGAGGSAILKAAGAGAVTLDSVTVGYNTASPGGLAALRSSGAVLPTLINSIVSNNDGNCAGTFVSLGYNIGGDTSCGLVKPSDQAGISPQIQPMADNGGPTPTLRLPPGSPAINKGTCNQTEDQRNAVRPAENEESCDAGAFEFEGFAKVEIPPCSQTGRLPFRVDSPPETGAEALDYTVDGGDPQTPLRVLGTGASSFSGTIEIPEGRRRLEYWADSFPTGIDKGVQLKHATPLVVVDRTDPRVAVSNPNEFRVFVIKRRANVEVTATDAISGLVHDPSGERPLDTSRRGAKTFAAGAVDLCTNTATAPFSYRVLAPALGVRTVLERVKGRVLGATAAGGSAARASQKGRNLTAIREPREVAVRSLIDTRRGTVRLTSSRSTGTAIQDGQFSGGVFQVLQSRRRSAKGLTELRLKGSSFRACRGAARSRRASAAARRRVIRRLRGNGRGRFRTRGRFSAATVRGTRWTVEDRCDGTLTRVTRGRVAVRDFRRRKTVTVRAGKSYLARAPR